MQCVEIGNAVKAKDHSFAVDDELLCPVLRCAFNNPGEALCPIVSASREQPNAITIALHTDAIAVILTFVKPIPPGRNA